MSDARKNFLGEISALQDAVSMSTVGTPMGLSIDLGVSVLRRGAAIAGLVMLEAFIRDRTEEVLIELGRWPAQYVDLPERFRRRATIEALPNIEKYARMLRRNDEDYEAEILREANRIASMSPPTFQFTRFVVGDYTGNISEDGIQELLKVFQIKDCWNSMTALSREIGLGVPSLREVLKAVIRNRHQSAHQIGYTPAAADVLELPLNLRLIGICIDAALTASIRMALDNWRLWVSESFEWKSGLEIYFVSESGNKFRIVKRGHKRAIRIVDEVLEAKSYLPRRVPGLARLLVEQSKDGRPKTWDIA